MNGQDDYDTLLGGAGAETFLGAAQNDRVDGNGGADIGLLGTGHDTFVWDPGDGSDIVEEQAAGHAPLQRLRRQRELRLLGQRQRLRFFRTSATSPWTPTTSNGSTSKRSAADNAVVNDLTGTDVTLANIDLEGVLGGGAGDGQPDTITAKGTAGGEDQRDLRLQGDRGRRPRRRRARIRRAEQGSDLLAIDGAAAATS